MILYLLNVSAIVACCLLFYKLLLHKETFYPLNRFVLLGCLLVAFILPLITVPERLSFRQSEIIRLAEPPAVEKSSKGSVSGADLPQQVNPETPAAAAGSPFTHITFEQVMVWLIRAYWVGVGIFVISFLVQLFNLVSRIRGNPIIEDGRYKIVEIKDDKAPCSFGSYIFINPEKYEWETYSQILLHEKIHIRQRHTLDIMIAELAMIFLWFNPFAWLYRKSIEDNLEFLTDNELLEHRKVEKNSYQMSLLKVSAPNFPLSVTTNYNQSLLKKRVLMMNAKKSNVHTTWKYLFLVPLLLTLMSFLNKPAARAGAVRDVSAAVTLQNEGMWFANIKNEKVSFKFKNDEQDENVQSGSFLLADFRDLPRTQEGKFTVTREAGTMEFTGKFDNQDGMGRYKFTPNNDFGDYLNSQQIYVDKDKNLITLFLVDVRKAYVKALQAEGYTQIRKNQLITLAALKIDVPYIQSLKAAGLSTIPLQELISLKALNVNGEYIKEIKNAGYPHLTAQQLITFKSQGIDAKYITAVKESGGTRYKYARVNADSALNKLKTVNTETTPNKLQSPAVQPSRADVKKSDPDSKPESDSDEMEVLLAMRSLHVTPYFIKSFEEVGYKVSNAEAVRLKANSITAASVQALKEAGFPDITLAEVISLKSLRITPYLIEQYKNLGYPSLSIEDLTTLKSLGISPTYIQSMKDKGYDFKNIRKYAQTKTIIP
jgi:hypothetical protein